MEPLEYLEFKIKDNITTRNGFYKAHRIVNRRIRRLRPKGWMYTYTRAEEWTRKTSRILVTLINQRRSRITTD